MWNALGAVAADWHEKVQSESVDVNSARMPIKVGKAVHYVKQLWENSKLYRVSDAVMMVEKEVISRLQSEGNLCLQAPYNAKKLDIIRLVSVPLFLFYFIFAFFVFLRGKRDANEEEEAVLFVSQA